MIKNSFREPVRYISHKNDSTLGSKVPNLYSGKFASRFWLLLFVPIVIGLIVQISSPLTAQEAPEPAETAEQTAPERPIEIAPVVIDGNELFVIIGLAAFPAKERAAKIVDAILNAAELSDKSIVNMEIRPGEFGPEIFAGDIKISTITELDAQYEGAQPDLLAALQSAAIQEAIIGYRTERSEKGRIKSTIRALLLTALFVGFSFVLFWFRKRFSIWLESRVSQKLEKVESVTNKIVQGQNVAMIVAAAVRLLLVLLFVVVLYYYMSTVLHSFVETHAFADDLLKLLTDPIFAMAVAIISQIPNLVALVVIVLITRFIIKTVKLVFDNLESGAFNISGFEPQWIWPTFNIARVVIILLALIFAFPYIPGSNSSAFKGVSILVGVMMSFGSSSVVGNLLAGIFVIYKRSTNIGDRIKVGEHIGDVIAIKLMETHLKSLKNELISIPNSLLLSTDVVNYSTNLDDNGLLVHTTVGIGYEEPQRRIAAMLIDAANRTKLLKTKPKPFVLRTALADFSVHYQINAYSIHGDKLPIIMSDLHANILDVFNEQKVQIMTPSYIADTPEPKIAPLPNTD